MGWMRVANAVPDFKQNITVNVTDSNASTATPYGHVFFATPYQTISPYQNLSVGLKNVTVKYGNVTLPMTANITADQPWTFALHGLANPGKGMPKVDVTPYGDYNGDYPSNDGELRFINLSPDEGAVDVTVKRVDGVKEFNETIGKDLKFTDAADYDDLEPGEYQVDVWPTGKIGTKATSSKNVTISGQNPMSVLGEGLAKDKTQALVPSSYDTPTPHPGPEPSPSPQPAPAPTPSPGGKSTSIAAKWWFWLIMWLIICAIAGVVWVTVKKGQTPPEHQRLINQNV